MYSILKLMLITCVTIRGNKMVGLHGHFAAFPRIMRFCRLEKSVIMHTLRVNARTCNITFNVSYREVQIWLSNSDEVIFKNSMTKASYNLTVLKN